MRAFCVLLFIAARAAAEEPGEKIEVPVSASRVDVVDSVPAGNAGADVRNYGEAFGKRTVPARNGSVQIEAGRDPVYVLDGDTTLPTPPAADSPFGFHPALVSGKGGPFAAAREIGVRWHRGLYAYWVLVQPAQEDIDKGVFHWERNDREWGAVPEGMAIFANLGLPERTGEKGDPRRSSWKLNQTEEAYLSFVRAAVERYDGDGRNDMPGLKVPIRHWQVENEPDLGGNRDWEGFARIQAISFKAIKEACPEAVVAMGGQTGGGIPVFDAFYAPILEKLGGKCVDVYDLHYYGDAKLDWLGVQKVYEHIRKRLDELGYAATEIWITEIGSYSGRPGDEESRRDPRDPEPPMRRRPLPAQSEREQARDVVKRHVWPLALGVKKVFWAFGLMEGFKHDDGYFDHTGFLYDGEFDGDPERGTPKLAYFAYRRMTELLDGADWSRAGRLELGAGVYAVRVPRGKGTVTIVWRDPPFPLSSRVAPEDARRIRDALAALAKEKTGEFDDAARFRKFREIIHRAMDAGGPAVVESWAPREEVSRVEEMILSGDKGAAEALDALISRARDAWN